MQRVFKVSVEWDEEAGVYYVSDSDVPGLATEATTFEEMQQRVLAVIPELVELNRDLLDGGDLRDIPVHVMASRLGHVRAAG